MNRRNILLFAAVALLFIATGLFQTWNTSLFILNTALISAIFAMGVNMQWGYAGLFNTGVMGFTALGGLAVVLVSARPVAEGWQAGGAGILTGLFIGAASIGVAIFAYNRMKPGRRRNLAVIGLMLAGFILYRFVFDPAVTATEAYDPATAGNLGGLGLPSLIAWPVGGLLAALAAWAIGKTALGLRSDYLAIATLGIAEIIVSVMKNEDWLARGVKMVNGLPRPWPVPYEVDLQKQAWFTDLVTGWGYAPTTASAILVKLIYAVMFTLVLIALVWLAERALNSPWGRMMRAIRDNEVAAEAMGKDVTRQHLLIFIIGSAVIGVGGAIMVSMHGLLNPGTYNPLGFTFLVWVMVIVGGSGNNWGSILGALLIGWLWQMAETVGPTLMGLATGAMTDSPLKSHLVESAPHLRLLTVGVILLLVLRFNPRGLIPEK